jgi:hypothetical protein
VFSKILFWCNRVQGRRAELSSGDVMVSVLVSVLVGVLLMATPIVFLKLKDKTYSIKHRRG